MYLNTRLEQKFEEQWAGDYDSSVGRFLQEDPYNGNIKNPNSFYSKYVYASQNPIVNTDPAGFFSKYFGKGFNNFIDKSFNTAAEALNKTVVLQALDIEVSGADLLRVSIAGLFILGAAATGNPYLVGNAISNSIVAVRDFGSQGSPSDVLDKHLRVSGATTIGVAIGGTIGGPIGGSFAGGFAAQRFGLDNKDTAAVSLGSGIGAACRSIDCSLSGALNGFPSKEAPIGVNGGETGTKGNWGKH